MEPMCYVGATIGLSQRMEEAFGGPIPDSVFMIPEIRNAATAFLRGAVIRIDRTPRGLALSWAVEGPFGSMVASEVHCLEVFIG